jgi:WD40 repeat protein
MFQGHFSASTIKGVNFYGPNSEYVMTGSDDAKVFIWDKATGELVQVLEGHKSIVNCIIGHPNIPMIASSGIDTEVCREANLLFEDRCGLPAFLD